MRTIWVRSVKILALLLSVALMVGFLQNTLFYHYDENYHLLRGFYREPKHSLDVVLVGASDMFNGFSPGYAYDYSGLTSYLYGCFGNRGSSYLSHVKEILAHQNPGMLLFEVHGFLAESEESYYEEVRLRHYVENIPMSLNRITTILQHEYDDPLSCIFPFFKYHGRWTDDLPILRDRFLRAIRPASEPTRLKGYISSSVVSSYMSVYDVADNDETLELLPAAEQDLIELLEYLQKCDVEHIVFTRFPHQLLDEEGLNNYLRSNRVEEIVTSYGFDFLDLEQNNSDVGISYDYDFTDPDHLNFYGQVKVTEYLCDLLLNEYGLEPMVQTEENQLRWNETAAYTYALQEYADELGAMGELVYLSETPELLQELEQRLM